MHKRELWSGHAQALVDGNSLRKVAARLDVHLSTAFRWRHRFLKEPKTVKSKVLDGTVEADETYFLHSEKGSRKLERPARKRGGKATKRGLSHEQVAVLIAGDRNNATTMRQRPFAVRTRWANVTVSSKFENQNFFGSFSTCGHSINSHSSESVSAGASRSCAERTRTRAKRDERRAFVPSRQTIVRQLLFGGASASCSTLTGLRDRQARMIVGDRQRNRDLTIVLFPELSAILPRDTDRMLALFRKASVVEDPR